MHILLNNNRLNHGHMPSRYYLFFPRTGCFEIRALAIQSLYIDTVSLLSKIFHELDNMAISPGILQRLKEGDDSKVACNGSGGIAIGLVLYNRC